MNIDFNIPEHLKPESLKEILGELQPYKFDTTAQEIDFWGRVSLVLHNAFMLQKNRDSFNSEAKARQKLIEFLEGLGSVKIARATEGKKYVTLSNDLLKKHLSHKIGEVMTIPKENKVREMAACGLFDVVLDYRKDVEVKNISFDECLFIYQALFIADFYSEKYTEEEQTNFRSPTKREVYEKVIRDLASVFKG